jgi:protein SCO1/2
MPMSTDAAISPRPLSQRVHDFVAALVAKPLFWIIFVVLGIALPIARTVTLRAPPLLPVLGQVQDFTLTDQFGKPYGSEQLKGRVWVANFIFTRCPTICPVFTAQMGKVQHRVRNLGEAFHLVSFTVDPEFDTPEVLNAYAKTKRVSPRMWSFLTGERPDIKNVVMRDMKVHMTKDGPDDDLMSIGHGSHFVLIDPKMQVRGYYDSNDPSSLDTLVRDVGLVVNRGG